MSTQTRQKRLVLDGLQEIRNDQSEVFDCRRPAVRRDPGPEAGPAGPSLIIGRPHALVAQLDRASDFDSEGREFESLRARHFGTKLGTAKPAVFALVTATNVRRSTLFDPMIRTSFASTSMRW